MQVISSDQMQNIFTGKRMWVCHTMNAYIWVLNGTEDIRTEKRFSVSKNVSVDLKNVHKRKKATPALDWEWRCSF